MVQPKTLILTGPTAVGKTKIAIEFAEKNKIEIINADSICFYREFNIGSAKPTPLDLKRVPHHLIDVISPNEVYHAGEFLKDCERKITEIHERGNRALIVGGSGFYLKALRFGLWAAPATSPEFRESLKDEPTPRLFEQLSEKDLDHALKVGPNDRYRLIRGLEILKLSGKKPSELEAQMPDEPKSEFALFVLARSPADLALRIKARVNEMIELGLVDEFKQLHEKYPDSKVLRAVGYLQVGHYLEGIEPEGRSVAPGILGLKQEIELAHRQLAKHQRTWFNQMKADAVFHLESEHSLLIEKLMRFYQ